MMDLLDLSYFIEGDENALLGTAQIFGADFHLTAIRVETLDDGTQRVLSDPNSDAEEGDEPSVAAQLWEQFLEFEDPDGPIQTVRLDVYGFPGDWAIWLVPKPE